jgi:hypothetical protein
MLTEKNKPGDVVSFKPRGDQMKTQLLTFKGKIITSSMYLFSHREYLVETLTTKERIWIPGIWICANANN